MSLWETLSDLLYSSTSVAADLMDNEYDILCQNNEKYSIKIADYKIHKFYEIVVDMKEDLKLCRHLIDKSKQLIKII
ncbi:unnamed protein product [Rotaria sp. Silwood1]|nr:unnamed protein product [Rotaria sp. Silwood1]CAF1586488.1 unnamed protein product [Rotaria sp. Silwood1]